jgi:hypothetical protein
MTALTVPLILDLCALDSRLGRSLSESDPVIVHISPRTSEITIKAPVVWPDVSHFPDSAGADRRNSIGSAHAVYRASRAFRPGALPIECSSLSAPSFLPAL